MTTLVLEHEPIARGIGFSSDFLTVSLADGRMLIVPLAWYPRLLNATKAELRNWRLLGDGYAIEWPDLDEHIGVEGLIAGNHSGESARSFNRWLESRTKQKKPRKRQSRKAND
jgi:Protein of unknown function (DUF2442)